MSIRLLKFLEEIGAYKITLDFVKRNIVNCAKCKFYWDWFELCDRDPLNVIECSIKNPDGVCADFKKLPWWKFWR